MAQQHKPLLVRRQFYDNDRSVEDAMLVQLSRDKVKGPTPWGEAYVAPAMRPFVLMPEVWELNTNRAIATADRSRRQLDFEMTAHGDLLMSLTLRAKAPPLATPSHPTNFVSYPPALILSLIHRAELWVGHTLVERLEPEYIHIWQRLACHAQPKEAQGRVGDQSHHDSAHAAPLDQYVVLPFFFHRGQSPLPIQKVRDNCGGRLGGPEGGIRVRIYLRDLSEICPRLSSDPGTVAPPDAASALPGYDDFQFQLVGRTAMLGDDEARHVRKADFSTVVPHVESLHQDEDGTLMRDGHQMTELPLRVERPVTRLIWAVRDKHILPDAQGSHTYAQGVRKLAGPPVQPLLGDFNVLREGSAPSRQVVDEIVGPSAGPSMEEVNDIISVTTGSGSDLHNLTNNGKGNWAILTTGDSNALTPSNPVVLDITPTTAATPANRLVLWWRNNSNNVGIFPKDLDVIGVDAQGNETTLKQVRNFSQDDVNTSTDATPTDANATLIVDWQMTEASSYATYRIKFLANNYGDDPGETGGYDDRVILGELALRHVFSMPVGSTDLKTSRTDLRPGSLHLWGDRFDFRTTDEQGVEMADPIEHVQLKLDGQDRLPDDSNMRAAYFRLVDPHDGGHASRSQGQQPGVYSYTFARHADSLSHSDPEARAVTGSINLAKVQDKVLRLRHRVRGREAVLFVWAECLNIFEMGSSYGSYGMRYA